MKEKNASETKTAAEVLAELAKKSAAPPTIADDAGSMELRKYWRAALPRKYPDMTTLPPFTAKEIGQFKLLEKRSEGRAGLILRWVIEDWSGCRAHLMSITDSAVPTRPHIGVVLTNLVYVLNWVLGKAVTVQSVAKVEPVEFKVKEEAKSKTKPIWLEE